jgi:ribonuclease HI
MTKHEGVEGTYLLMADGAARGNPGPAAYGFVLLAPDGQAVAEEGAVLGRATNNVAEYEGLIAGMERALTLGVRRLDVRLDSELVVRQMSGQYRVKNAGLKPLFARAQGLRQQFEAVTFEHIRRAENRRADELANQSLDAQEGGRVGSQSGDRGGS